MNYKSLVILQKSTFSNIGAMLSEVQMFADMIKKKKKKLRKNIITNPCLMSKQSDNM